jgi:hypothetical protein
MVDTITIDANWPARNRLPVGKTFSIIHGVKVRTDRSGSSILWVECSLPRLLFGHNGRLLENQGQLRDALDRLRIKLLEFVTVPPVEQWKVSRLDIVWNFDLPASYLIRAHSTLMIPGVRNGATLWCGGAGVSWKAAKSRFVIRMYDKTKKMHVSGQVLRVEISLRQNHLYQRLDGARWQDWCELWRIAYSILSTIPTIGN